ncbi:MAG: hypothetical protein ACD_17C00222G0001 [uncultured bacterium]|nr:MAG: hypothetical protein ACD_17C00222G0001 [uncultured bacterium]
MIFKMMSVATMLPDGIPATPIEVMSVMKTTKN